MKLNGLDHTGVRGRRGGSHRMTGMSGPTIFQHSIETASRGEIPAVYMFLRSNASNRGWPFRGVRFGSIASHAGET